MFVIVNIYKYIYICCYLRTCVFPYFCILILLYYDMMI